MHSPSGLEASLRNSEGSCHTSAIEQNLCHLMRLVSCISFSTQLYSPCTLNWVGATLQLPIPNVVAKTQLLSLVQWAQMLWLSFLAICRQSSSPWCAATARASSCTKILLTLRMWPVAIALNYSVKNIRNKVRQNTLAWGSLLLTLAPLKNLAKVSRYTVLYWLLDIPSKTNCTRRQVQIPRDSQPVYVSSSSCLDIWQQEGHSH